MRIFVTGDNHIGKKYANYDGRETLVSERLEALSRMVEKANEEECGLFAITGDLFDKQDVSQKTVKAVVNALGGFQGIVAVLPGNHDYFDESSGLWAAFEKCTAEKDNIVMLKEDKPYYFDEINSVIYPAFCDKLHSAEDENKLNWIKKENFPNDGKIRIGMAHGTVEGLSYDKEGKYFVMTRRELDDIPVDAWLTGHSHVPFPKDLATEFASTDEKIFNPGAHVQTDVNNNTEGFCFILEFDEAKRIKAKKYVSGNIRFYEKEIAVTAGNMESNITEALKEFGDNSVVDLTISGAVSEGEYQNRRETIDKACGRFIECKCNCQDITLLITKELVEREFPIETSFARGFLGDLLDDPKEAQLAFDLIKSVKEGK